ncbi:MAG: SigE family RNA polymerase sigma factor [Nocardioides sp.]
MTRRQSRQEVEAEFTEFVRSWWAYLYRTAYLLVGERGHAEDLLQASLTKTYLAWPRLRDPAAAPAYTRKAIFTQASSWFRRRSWQSEVPHGELPEPSDTPMPGGIAIEERWEVLEALRQLSPRQRAVIVLRYYEEMSVDETATVLGCSTGTVKRHGFDALSRLRELMGVTAGPIPRTATPIDHGGK